MARRSAARLAASGVLAAAAVAALGWAWHAWNSPRASTAGWDEAMATVAAQAAAHGQRQAAAPRHAAVGPQPISAAALEAIVAREPQNGRAWALLGYQRAEAARWAEAAQAFEQAVAHGPKIAADPAVWCEWADVLAMAQGGRLAGRPTELIAKALALRPGHPQALEMAGSAAYERGDFATALRHWEALRAQLAGDAGRAQELDAAIARARRKAATALPAG